MKWVKTLALATALALTASGCGTLVSKDADYEGSITFSLALGPDSHHAAGAYAFAERLAELTDDRISVDYYYNNALGGEREVVEGMSINSIQMGMASTGPMGGFVRSFMLFDMPYIFRDLDHVYTVLDGEIGEELAAEFEETASVRIIGWTENGFRYETNSVRPIRTPEDLQGIKHRTQESAAQIQTWRAFGTDALPMAWPEVYTGLQQGVIDSQENPIATIADVNFQEVQDYIAMTQHVYSPAPMMISSRYFETFSEGDQEAILAAGEYATGIQREASAEAEAAALQELLDAGMEQTEIDREAFEEAAQPVIDDWREEIPRDLIDRVIATEAEPGAAATEQEGTS
ncbi:TRAP transporter substrate-binding protein DctP [Brevibacterium album]|uniref:TRAP transporter substrate-binding protein DctP n=1 Tax=Brevibacterium album TaxID=417948 RepID=UPI00041B3B33|nr:TRAP transporter substrate-binding protein DctP [Brevibacterium album]